MSSYDVKENILFDKRFERKSGLTEATKNTDIDFKDIRFDIDNHTTRDIRITIKEVIKNKEYKILKIEIDEILI